MIRKLVQFIKRIKLTNHSSKHKSITPLVTFELGEEHNLLKFLYALSIIIISVYVIFIQVIEYKADSLRHAANNSQAILVEITTNQIISGKLFNYQNQEHCQPLKRDSSPQGDKFRD